MTMSYDEFKQHCLPIMAAILMATMWGLPLQSSAAAPEQRCTELGSNCLCSEPLNTTTYTQGTASHRWNPADSTTKECALEHSPGTAVIRNAPMDFAGSNDPQIVGALPVGHSVSWVLKAPEGTTGIFELGHWFNATDPVARRALRWYLYFSPNWVPTGGACLNSGKLLRLTDQGPVMSYNGNWQMYSWTDWNISGYPCCYVGPGSGAGAQSALQVANIVGKWHRLEVIETNASNSAPIPTRIQVFWKNVTDDGPEYTVIDTAIPTTQPVDLDWTITQATTLHHTGPTDVGSTEIDWFRNGTCPGYFAASHMLWAAWSTDAGQRIGAAYEIEGRTSPPAAPGSLRIR